MSKHLELIDLLVNLPENKCTPEEKERFEQHLEECDRCRHEYEFNLESIAAWKNRPLSVKIQQAVNTWFYSHVWTPYANFVSARWHERRRKKQERCKHMETEINQFKEISCVNCEKRLGWVCDVSSSGRCEGQIDCIHCGKPIAHMMARMICEIRAKAE